MTAESWGQETLLITQPLQASGAGRWHIPQPSYTVSPAKAQSSRKPWQARLLCPFEGSSFCWGSGVLFSLLLLDWMGHATEVWLDERLVESYSGGLRCCVNMSALAAVTDSSGL